MQDFTRVKGKHVWVNLPPLRIWYPMELLAPSEVSRDVRDELNMEGDVIKTLCFVKYLSNSGEFRYSYAKPVRNRNDVKTFDGPWMNEYTRTGNSLILLRLISCSIKCLSLLHLPLWMSVPPGPQPRQG